MLVNEELAMHCNKMSYLLGLSTGLLSELIRSEQIPVSHKQPLANALNKINFYINTQFYKQEQPLNETVNNSESLN